MPRTINETATDANSLFQQLTTGIDLSLDLPALELPTDFEMPDETGPAYEALDPVTVEQLTTTMVDGTGVFDVLMRAVRAHLAEEHKSNRITGADYAKVLMGALGNVMQFGTQFLLSKDRVVLENMQLQESVKLAQAQRVRAAADVQIARAQIQQAVYGTTKLRLEAKTALNQFAISKMSLINSYNDSLVTEANIQVAEANIQLMGEQVEVQRAQTRDTHLDGTPITGLLGKQRNLLDVQVLTAEEQVDVARAQTKDTLLSGSPIGGITAVDKAFKEAQQSHMENQALLMMEQVQAAHAQVSDTKTDGVTPIAGLLGAEKVIKVAQGKLTEEQIETARAQTKDTLTNGQPINGITAVDKQIKLAQKALTEEQVDSARAQTKDTLVDGTPVTGMALTEKNLKNAQKLYVHEQYETQRGQTRSTLSTGETVVGLVGVQVRLYEQQITSYKRDAESKGVKMLLDTWTARKTIDEGVAVPASIDGSALNNAIAAYTTNLNL